MKKRAYRARPGVRERERELATKRRRAAPEAARQRVRDWQAKNKAKVHAAFKAWCANNPGYFQAACAKRKRLIAGATIGDSADVLAFYKYVWTAKVVSCHYCGTRLRKKQ